MKEESKGKLIVLNIVLALVVFALFSMVPSLSRAACAEASDPAVPGGSIPCT